MIFFLKIKSPCNLLFIFTVESRELADEIDVDSNFESTIPRHRVRSKKINFSYEARDEPIKEKYKIDFFYFTIDQALKH